MAAETKLVFEQINTVRGFQQIYDQVRVAISEGELKPGDRLPAERKLAEIFGASRAVVREALRALEAAGLILLRTGATGGAFIRVGEPSIVARAISDVASLGGFSSESLLETRILLTSWMIRLASERADEEDFQRLEADVDDLKRADLHSESRLPEVMNFYRILASASHNEVLAALSEALNSIVLERLNRVGPDPRSNIAEVRQRILAHMRAKDAEAAVEEVTNHLTALEKNLLEKEQLTGQNDN